MTAIRDSVRRNSLAEQAQSGPISVPPPGPDLAADIAGRVDAGRPGWRIGFEDRDHGVPALAVPRVTTLGLSQRGRIDLFPQLRPTRAVLTPRLALALEAPGQIDPGELRPQDITSGRRLWMAALRDLAKLNEGEVAEVTGLDPRKVRNGVQRGRRDWGALGAWPWAFLAGNRPPHPEWRKDGANALLTEVYRVWATGRMRFSKLSGARTEPHSK